MHINQCFSIINYSKIAKHKYARISISGTFDPTTPHRAASSELLCLQQGACTVVDYPVEFWTLAASIRRPDEALVDIFLCSLSSALKDELVAREVAAELKGFINLAEQGNAYEKNVVLKASLFIAARVFSAGAVRLSSSSFGFFSFLGINQLRIRTSLPCWSSEVHEVGCFFFTGDSQVISSATVQEFPGPEETRLVVFFLFLHPNSHQHGSWSHMNSPRRNLIL